MKLYHFCPAHMLQGIKERGLIFGQVPLFSEGKTMMIPGYQWLTLNGDFDQSWEQPSTLPYRRNAYRITVKIPKSDSNLVKWLDLCKNGKIKNLIGDLNSEGDPENWYLYKGRIRPGSFREIVENPYIKKG